MSTGTRAAPAAPAARPVQAGEPSGQLTHTVGVVIATRDRRESLLSTLEQLAALPERPAVVVVDNASSDGTPGAVARAHPDVRVLRLRHNQGAAARNAGALALETALVAFSDDDSWWAPGGLAAAARAFAEHPRLALLAARILVGPGQQLDPTCEEMAASPLPRAADLPGPSLLGFVACGAVLRRSAFLGVGGFHPRLGVGAEEGLLALDLAAAGWGLAYVDEVIAHHHPAAARDGRGDRRAAELRNALWTTWLRRPGRTALGRSSALAAVAVRERRAGALARAIAGLPWVMRERRPVPPELDRAAAAVERLSARREP